jgi:hypothetical protein
LGDPAQYHGRAGAIPAQLVGSLPAHGHRHRHALPHLLLRPLVPRPLRLHSESGSAARLLPPRHHQLRHARLRCHHRRKRPLYEVCGGYAIFQEVEAICKGFHNIFAYLIIILFKINILFNWYITTLSIFAFLTAWDVFFLLLWAYLKFYKEDLQSTVIDMRTRKSDKTIQEIGSMMELQEWKDPYVIYNGYVYDASRLIVHHPGGQKVISSMLGREVDRFLYGMYSS